MPPAKKIDQLPEEDLRWLMDELRTNGFGGIVEVTERLNERPSLTSMGMRIGKSAVGEFAKDLKVQHVLAVQSEASGIAEAMMGEMDVDQESALYKSLTQMIATLAMKSLVFAHAGEAPVAADQLMAFGRMLKDLTGSAGSRVRLEEAERKRIEDEARAAVEAEVEGRVEKAVAEVGLSGDRANELRREILGVRG